MRTRKERKKENKNKTQMNKRRIIRVLWHAASLRSLPISGRGQVKYRAMVKASRKAGVQSLILVTSWLCETTVEC